MQKQFTALAMAIILALSALTFSGCGSETTNYPVSVGNLTFENEPKNIVILSDDVADIVSFIGYDVKMIGRSEEVTQSDLSAAHVMGSESTPDTAKVIASNPDLVLAGADLDAAAQNTLESQGIKVVKMLSPQNLDELETAYRSIGTMLGGKVTGAQKGENGYNELVKGMDSSKATHSGGNILNTVCYLYVEDNQLKTLGNKTFGAMLLDYTGAVNVSVGADTKVVDENNLRIANPTYIFYSDSSVLDYLHNSDSLKGLSALNSNKIKEIPIEDVSRPGKTALTTLSTMTDFMYNKTEQNTNTPSAELIKQYNISITDDGLKPEDDNLNVLAMQSRLNDLGYIYDGENVTGFYGETSEKAVSAFQKNNGITETGIADKATLNKMFTSDAVKATTPVDKAE